MKQERIKELIYKHFKTKDIGVGLLSCISEEKDVDELATELFNNLSQHLVSKCELTGEDMIEFSKYISSKGYEHRLNIMPNALIKFYLENRDSIIENNNVC